MSNKFCSKVLLFGEYGVIHGADALAVPFDNFSGSLSFDRSYDLKSNRELKSFHNYLSKYSNDWGSYKLDLEAFKFDIEQGLVFKSTIPQGYGLGSSGALCASVFDKYCNTVNVEHIGSDELIKLKDFFGKMESHFHGKSSGFEPLVSYLSKPILYKDAKQLLPVNFVSFKNLDFFIIDTGRGRSTEPLVNLYFEKLKDESFKNLCEVELKQVTNKTIECFMEKKEGELLELFSEISHMQYENFQPMIPPLYRGIWKKGLESSLFKLKLCGAGGGGFLLGLTTNIALLKETYPSESIKTLNF